MVLRGKLAQGENQMTGRGEEGGRHPSGGNTGKDHIRYIFGGRIKKRGEMISPLGLTDASESYFGFGFLLLSLSLSSFLSKQCAHLRSYRLTLGLCVAASLRYVGPDKKRKSTITKAAG